MGPEAPSASALQRVAMGLFGMIAILPMLWHLDMLVLHRTGVAPRADAELWWAIAGAVASVVAAALILLPGPQYWFLRRRRGSVARFVTSVARGVFAIGVVQHYLATFNQFSFMDPIEHLVALGAYAVAGVFLVSFVFPGGLARNYALGRAPSLGPTSSRELRMRHQTNGEEPMTIYRVEQAEVTALDDLAPYTRTGSAAAQVFNSKDTTRQAKRFHAFYFVFLLLVFGVFALGIYGEGYAKFAPYAEHVDWWRRHEASIYIGGVVFVLLSIPFTPRGRGLLFGNGVMRVLILGPTYAALLLSFSESAALRGVPMFLATFEGDGAITETTVRVAAIGPYEARRRCDGAVAAVGDVYLGPAPILICETPRLYFNQIEPGDSLTLRGYAARFGMRYDMVRR